MAKVKYREGDWFAVPLPSGGYAVGIIARASRSGVLLGYFFGPRREQVPILDDLAALRPADAVWVHQFGDMGLVRRTQTNHEWTVIGRLEDWDPAAWPMPVFGRYEELTGRAFKVYYPDHDPNGVPRQQRVPLYDIEDLPPNDMAGAGYAENRLDGLLSQLNER